MPGYPINPTAEEAYLQSEASPGKDPRKSKTVHQTEDSFKRLQQTAVQSTWFWGTVLQSLSKDWSWR